MGRLFDQKTKPESQWRDMRAMLLRMPGIGQALVNFFSRCCRNSQPDQHQATDPRGVIQKLWQRTAVERAMYPR